MGMPAHVENLLVEVDLVRIGLLTHPLRATRRRARPVSLLAVLAASVHGRGDADLLRFERALVRL